jgi:SAM-dependent methyltransferase
MNVIPEATRRARAWLDRRLADALAAHLRSPSPRYGAGGRVLRTDRIHVAALARRVCLLRRTWGGPGPEFLDVGGGFGEFAALVREADGRAAWLLDLSPAFLVFARAWMGVRPVCADASALPFARHGFGTVACCEVVEHLEHPVLAFLEFSRVARESLVVSTDQCCQAGWEYRLRMAAAERGEDFSDRNWFLPGDLALLMGEGTELSASLAAPRRAHGMEIRDARALAAAVEALSPEMPFGRGAGGILAVRGARVAGAPAHRDLVARVIEADREADARFLGAAKEALEIIQDERPHRGEPPDLAMLRCPAPGCAGTLSSGAGEPLLIACARCGAGYEARWGIPILDPPRYPGIEEALEGIAPARAAALRALAERIARAGRHAWARGPVWALMGVTGFLRLPVGPAERLRILRGWMRDAIRGTRDPGAGPGE